MFEPKCYTLINKMYEPKKDIRRVRRKIYEWTSKLDNMLCEDNSINSVFVNIIKYIDYTEFPAIHMEFYEETLEGWNLITHRNKLEKEYPNAFKELLLEERKIIRETLKMMKEDHKCKW